MKKTLLMLAVLIGVTFSGATAYASTTTDPVGNGDPMQIGMPWGLTGWETPRVPAGAIVIDEAGNADKCPDWFRMGCFDITRTQYYRDAMIETVRQIREYGFAVPTQWLYWTQFLK